MKKYIPYLFIFIAIVIACTTRFYKLGEAPGGFYVDEAGQGYSAYSIMETGEDEFGKRFPVVFRSLTDFKTPVYIYLIAPLIPLFGLNAFTVRFPSFLFSILTIPVLYFLIKEFTNRDKESKKTIFGVAEIAILLLSLSPWHILFGRTNFECNVALFFFLSGVLAFYKGLKNPKILIISAVMFAIAIPAYHSQRIITPLTIAVLFLKYRKILIEKKYINYLIGGGILALLISLPTIAIAATPGFLARASGLNIFTHLRQMPAGFNPNYTGIFSWITNGSWFLTTREFLALYISYLSPRQMFILGDYGDRSSFPELATFFVWQAPFYLWGIWVLLKKKVNTDFKFLIIALLLISPIPAAVTRDPYSTIRSLPLVIPQIIIVAIGIYDVFLHFKTKLGKLFLFTFFAVLVSYSILKLYSSVIILNEYYRAKYWDWGWKEVVEVLNKTDMSLPVKVDNARSDPELIIAFYLKYSPESYQKENQEVYPNEYYTNLTRVREKHVGRIVTSGISWEKDLLVDQYLVGDSLAISSQQIQEHNLHLISEIKYPDGSAAYRIVKTNPEWEKKQRMNYLSSPENK